ncbi:WD repeat, SAM and U-box domain-containing protein 1 [Chanos chanos]|uniref:WD repeat, SAM and U-box domain-containing protein 1 n=1 Tax=Chanos chanos TaxID=29144 RepID=A0A6J2WFZ5_CHACN|nr:WD repeat, SAM and U-box domain-containing protein 1 [Chanos chanos]
MVSLLRTLQDHLDDVNCCALSNSMLATCSIDKTIRVYTTNDFCELNFSPLSEHTYGVHCCCFSSCGRYLASCSTDATTIVWDMQTGKVEVKFEYPGRTPVRICSFSPDSSYLLSGATDGTVTLWDVPTKSLQRTRAATEGTLVASAFSPCGQMFVTGSTLGDLRVWNLAMNQLCAEKDAHDLGVNCCNFSPQTDSDGHTLQFRLASCGQDSQLKIWIISQHASAGCMMQLLHTLTGQSSPVLSCCFSSDGQRLISGSVDKTVAVYDANQAVLLHTLTQHRRYVTTCAFAPVGPLFVTGSMDKTVNIWMMGEGEALPALSTKRPRTTQRGRKLPGHSRLPVSDWTEEDVSAWLSEEGMEALVSTFKANNIDGRELVSLTKETLATELHVDSVGLRGKVLRKIEELKQVLEGSDVPDEFVCPITREVMKDPVMAADGYSYEREAIESWLKTKNPCSPMTNLPLQTTLLTPNRTLRMAINRWRDKR